MRQTRRVYTQNKAHHQKLKKAILDSGATIMCSQTGISFYVPSLATKYVPVWQCLNWRGEKLLPGEIARAEMDRHLPAFSKIRNWSGDQIKLLWHTWPMYCQGEYYGPAVYYDLVSAYHQFYSRMYLDVGYPCGYGTLDLAPVAEVLQDIKKARNAVIGIARSTKICMQQKNRGFSVPTKNRYLSPPLWANLMGWLQDIAHCAVENGACYAMMDGFFFPLSDSHREFETFLDFYQIKYRKKIGDIHIKGWGSYATDWGRVTDLYGKGGRGRVNTIRPHYEQSLKFVNWWHNSPDYRIWRLTNETRNTAK